jgi:hypothetical protein
MCTTETNKKVKLCSYFFFLMGWDWVNLVRRLLFGLLYQPQMIDDDCGAIGGMRIGRGNHSTRRKLASVPLCPLQIPHDLIQAGTRDAAVRSRRLTSWAMARPMPLLSYIIEHYAVYIWGRGGVARPILNSALDGCEWSASRLYHLSPWIDPSAPIG